MVERTDFIRCDVIKMGRMTALAGLLRGELAERAGVSRATVSEAFSGRPIGVRAARAIAKALGVSIADLAASEQAEAAVAAARGRKNK